jgi:hypothetical protein
MKKILVAIFCFLTVKAYSQIEIGSSPQDIAYFNKHSNVKLAKDDTLHSGYFKNVGVYMWPNQKINFNISIRKMGHEILIKDTAGKILYAQSVSVGEYNFITKKNKQVLVIYDIVNRKNYVTASIGVKDDLHAFIGYGKDDVEVKVAATLLPADTVTTKLNFVRFLKLGPVLIDEVHVSVSLSKIPPINIKTEPEINKDNGEYNLITDTLTYLKLKHYINTNKSYLQQDTIGLNYNNKTGSYKIVIDGENIFYLKSDKSNKFFENLHRYLRKENADERVVDQMIKDLYE